MTELKVVVPASVPDVDALAVPVSPGQRDIPAGVPAESRPALAAVLAAGEHQGALDEVWPLGAPGAGRLLLFGTGDPAELDGARLRHAHQFMTRAALGHGYRRLAVVVARSDQVTAVVEGSILGTWERRSRATGGRFAQLEQLFLVGSELDSQAAERALRLGVATNAARELQNTPANELSPADLVARAQDVAERRGLEFQVLGPRELEEKGYQLLLAVGAGSPRPPHLAVLRHRGGGPERLALVGKGITFDAGGISIKPAEGMDKMKADMAGAAAVVAAMDVIGERGPALDVLGVIAAADNMPDGASLRPGDVIQSAGVKSVEVVNTDAEGRLVLADAMTHAVSLGATRLVDVATLTGVAKRAIGHAATAVVGNDEAFFQQLVEAAKLAGERMWRLPAYADYKVLLRSLIADLRNSDFGEANTILGGMFIGEFVQGRPWLHLDIAASSWNDNLDLKTIPRGPSGAATRTLVRLAELLAVPGR